jgi:hypothetical protein
MSAQQLTDALRRSETAIVARVENDHVLMDLRTVFPEQDACLLASLVHLAQQ